MKEVVKEGQLLVLPFDGRETLEERTLSSAVIARVELASHRIVGARYSTFRDDYAPAIEFTFDVLEYLKGTGGATVTAWAFGVDMWNRHYADTPEEAKKKSWMLEQYRDTRWDDRQAIVFLQQPVVGEPYLLGYIGWRRTSRSNGSVEVTNTVTVSDDERQAWLPATTSAGASTRGVTGRSPEQHFFLEDPGATTTATTRSAPRGAATSPSGTAPTISKSSLKAKIAEIENGITSDAYRECVLGKHRVVRYARYLEASGKRFGLTFEHDLRSGAAAGTEAIYPHRFKSRSDSIGREWLVGPDKDLFTARQERVYSTRPLPQGEYKVFYNWRPVGWVDCPPYPKEALEYDEFRVTVVAPGGTLAESFFDPYAAGGAVTGTTTVGTISWQAGRVTADLTIDVTGHALDFIGLDGTTTLSLIVADATETDGTLSWTVPTQPWSAGDKLMLRVRRHEAPTPTATPTPIPTDRPVILFPQIPRLEKKKTSLEPAVKGAKMFLGREKRSPTRCTYYEARGSAVPVRAGEELAGHDGDGGDDDVLGVDARSRFEVVGRAPRGTAGVWSGLDGQPSGQLADTAKPGRR